MSDTPKTDAKEWITVALGASETGSRVAVVPASFARELERENAKLRADKERLDFCEQGGWEMIIQREDESLRDAIDAAKAKQS